MTLKKMFFGRMKRRQFWWRFMLSGFLCNFLAQFISRSSNATEVDILWTIVIIITIYQISLIIRRCHDASFSWWLTIATVVMSLIPLVSLIVFIILLCTKTTTGYNIFGAEPGTIDPQILNNHNED